MHVYIELIGTVYLQNILIPEYTIIIDFINKNKYTVSAAFSCLGSKHADCVFCGLFEHCYVCV